MNIIKKGYRKFTAFIISLIFAIITSLIFKAEILIPVLSFAGTALTVFFAANYGEHREENHNEKFLIHHNRPARSNNDICRRFTYR